MHLNLHPGWWKCYFFVRNDIVTESREMQFPLLNVVSSELAFSGPAQYSCLSRARAKMCEQQKQQRLYAPGNCYTFLIFFSRSFTRSNRPKSFQTEQDKNSEISINTLHFVLSKKDWVVRGNWNLLDSCSQPFILLVNITPDTDFCRNIQLLWPFCASE